MGISNSTLAALAKPFEDGAGPSHAVIEGIWASADAEPYLEEGNKLQRVLRGLQGLKTGRSARAGLPALPADEKRLQAVASELAMTLLTRGLVDDQEVAEALAEAEPPAAAGSGDEPTMRGEVPERRDPVADRAAVMVVHGRDLEAANAVFDWLRAVGLRPQEWGQAVAAVDDPTPFIGEVLEAAFRKAQAVVVLFTPDEHVQLRPGLAEHDEDQWRLQARPNVLLEAGMALGSHPKRTVLVALGEPAMPSDLAGRHYVRISSPASLRELASRLERADCPVDLSGTGWLDSKRFPDRSGLSGQPRRQAMLDKSEQTGEQRHRIEQLMAAEIASALEKVEEVLPTDGTEGKSTWPIGFANWSSAWPERRDEIASAFDRESFILLERAYERLRELERGMEKGGQPLGDGDREFFVRAQRQLADASALLLSPGHHEQARPPAT